MSRAIGTNPSMLWGWRKALRGEIEGAAAPAMTFPPVAMIEEPPSQPPADCDGVIRLEFGGAIRMQVPAAAPDALAAANARLQSTP